MHGIHSIPQQQQTQGARSGGSATAPVLFWTAAGITTALLTGHINCCVLGTSDSRRLRSSLSAVSVPCCWGAATTDSTVSQAQAQDHQNDRSSTHQEPITHGSACIPPSRGAQLPKNRSGSSPKLASAILLDKPSYIQGLRTQCSVPS